MTTTPTQWLPNTLVNPDTAEGRFVEGARVVGLSNGNFLVAYQELSTFNDDIPDLPFIQRGVLYDAQGNVLNDNLDLSQTGSALNEGGDFSQIVADDAGGFYVLYSDFANDTDTLILERYDASGALIADSVAAGPSEVGGFFQDMSLAVDTNGDVHVTYIRFDSTGGIDPTLTIILDSDLNPIAGTPADGLTLIADLDSTDDNNILLQAGALANGNVAYVTIGDNGMNVDLLIVDGTTGAVITEVEVRAPQGGSIAMRNPHVETLSDGSFVVVWRELVNDGSAADQKILSALFDVDGVQIGPIRVLDLPEDQTSFVIEEVLALDDGGYFVVTFDRRGAEAIQGTRFDADGNVVGETMAILIPNVSNPTQPEASVTSDGRILITYEDENDAVQVSIFDPRDTVIDANEGAGQTTARLDDDTTINGTADGETLLGQNGDDTLNGEGGDDVLNGGAGGDDLQAGAGDDVLVGDIGNDTLFGQSGEDELYGGGGKDLLVGGGNNDLIFGGNGVDRVNAGSGGDDVFGGIGNDNLFGNGGADELNGDDGDDRLVGGGGNDIFTGGAGDDEMSGGRGRDTFNIDAGADTIIGGSDKDIFIFNDESDVGNVITDYQDGIDKLFVEGYVAEDLTIQASGGDTVVFTDDWSVTFEGIDEGVITTGDFLFFI
jgi:Ca2+-binding RTX toxin-like protein